MTGKLSLQLTSLVSSLITSIFLCFFKYKYSFLGCIISLGNVTVYRHTIVSLIDCVNAVYHSSSCSSLQKRMFKTTTFSAKNCHRTIWQKVAVLQMVERMANWKVIRCRHAGMCNRRLRSLGWGRVQ